MRSTQVSRWKVRKQAPALFMEGQQAPPRKRPHRESPLSTEYNLDRASEPDRAASMQGMLT